MFSFMKFKEDAENVVLQLAYTHHI